MNGKPTPGPWRQSGTNVMAAHGSVALCGVGGALTLDVEIANAEDVLDRLEILWHKLEDEGWYVKANTVGLAIDEIKKLRAEIATLSKATAQ